VSRGAANDPCVILFSAKAPDKEEKNKREARAY
jgi:hypothetical protein